MNLLIASAIAAARNESVHAMLATRHLNTQKRMPNLGGTNGPPSPEAASEQANDSVLHFSTEVLGTPREAIKAHLALSQATADLPERNDELVAIVKGARHLRDWCDAVEVLAGRLARLQGVSVRTLANATGISERNAINRYKQVPGEGLTSYFSD